MAAATTHESARGVLAGPLQPPKPNLSSRPCLSGQGMQHEALCLQPDGHMRDPRGTAAFPPTLRLGTHGEGRTEASDGEAGRAPGVDPRPRVNHQQPLAELRHPRPDLQAVRVAADVPAFKLATRLTAS